MPSIAKLTPLQRKIVYVLMFIVNGALVAMTTANMIPAAYLGLSVMVTSFLTATMKAFMSESTTPADAAKKASLRPPAVPPLPLLCLAACAIMWLAGCAWARSPEGKTVIDAIVLSAVDVACITAQAEMGADEPALVSQACHIPPGLITSVVNQLIGHKAGMKTAREAKAKKASAEAACADGGAK